MRRKSCIILHISSLPSEYGIGKMGKHAFEFVDFLRSAGVGLWQILPLSPTSYGDSPYQSFSVYAGNPYFIDFEILEGDGLLERSDYADIVWETEPDRVNYSVIYENCWTVLRKAYERFTRKRSMQAEFKKYCDENKYWLDEYSLFMTLKDLNDGKPWYEWEDKDLVMHKRKTVSEYKEKLKKEMEFYKFVQYEFRRQWDALKEYVHDNFIEIIGDVPIYCSMDSVEAWAEHKIFQFDSKRRPICVAGCPPDDFSPTGQLWGNPVYNWDYLESKGFKWWLDRIEYAAGLYDIVRLDHFRGFEQYYTIPYGNDTAVEGEWVNGPGYKLFEKVNERLGSFKAIAEDLGFITPEVRQLLEKCGYPGMKVLQFGFSDGENEHLPHNFTTTNCYAYTGTHDNETLNGWVEAMDKKSLKFAKKYLGVKKKKLIPDAVIKATWGSVATVAAAQMQDFLGSPKEARMNKPSTLGNNWQFRMNGKQLTLELAEKIKKINLLYNRCEGDSDV